MVGAILVAAALAVGSILVLGPSSPWEEAVLATGRIDLDVPLTTLFTAPSRPNDTVTTSVQVSYSNGFWLNSSSGVPPSFIFYEWSVTSGTDLPVRFVMGSAWPSDPASRFEALPRGFEYFPAGPMPRHGSGDPPAYVNGSAVGAGVEAVLLTKWAMNYTVRKMGIFQGLLPTSYLEVDYRLSVLHATSIAPLASTNVSAPAAADLVTPSSPLSVDPGVPRSLDGNALSIDSRAPFQIYEPFHYNQTGVVLDAGPAGALQLRLMSTSEWSTICASMSQCWPTAAYTLTLSVSNETVWCQVYLDRRFGSLLIEYVSPPGP